MKVLFTLLALSITLTACTGTEPVVSEPVEEIEAQLETYTWVKHGISFEVPEGLLVSDMPYVDMLLIDNTDLTQMEGEIFGSIVVEPSDLSLEATLEELEKNHDENVESGSNAVMGMPESMAEDFKQEEVVINGKAYTKVTAYSDMGNLMMVRYVIELEGKVFIIWEGFDDLKDDVQTILETLSF